jgi:hypothetical protein
LNATGGLRKILEFLQHSPINLPGFVGGFLSGAVIAASLSGVFSILLSATGTKLAVNLHKIG